MHNIGVVGQQHPWAGSRVDYEDITGVWYVNGTPIDPGSAQQLQPYVVVPAQPAISVEKPKFLLIVSIAMAIIIGCAIVASIAFIH